MSRHPHDIQAAIEARVERDPNSGCWLWSGGLSGGYGMMYLPEIRANRGVHRLAFEAWVGPIPDGLVIDHMCRTRACCNPTHLRAVTPIENALENNDGTSATNKRKTHCKRGHEFTPANTYAVYGTGRMCKACSRLRYLGAREAHQKCGGIPRCTSRRAA